MLKHNSVFKLILIIFMTNTLISQQIIETDFDKSSKEQTVKQLSALLIDKYVFPETGKKMAEFINSNLNNSCRLLSFDRNYSNTPQQILRHIGL